MSESSEPKKYPPSSKKLQDLQKKGQFPKTQLADPTIQLIAFTGLMIFFFLYWFLNFSNFFYVALFAGIACQVSMVVSEISFFVIFFFVVKLVFSIIQWVLLNKSVVNTSEFGIKLDKLNPANGFKNSYGPVALFKSLKVVFELLALLFILKYIYDVFGSRLGVLLFVNNPDYFSTILVKMTIYASCIFIIYGIVVGTIDFMIETFVFLQKNKMTFTEVKNESKEMEGSPEMKSARRSAMREVMEAPMVKGRKPNFALANPQHILIPVCYEKDKDRAPLILGVSTDLRAEDEIKKLDAQGIPVVHNVELARKIYAKQSSGYCYIAPEFYKDVAIILISLRRQKLAASAKAKAAKAKAKASETSEAPKEGAAEDKSGNQ
ncbi:MAG: EscU/YscU/HrcU family type III secretion system export apparatus switch protein [Kistimonas sp.]|nr:EscU/YscU/HrcU family type III secretion system export apparatus switch protein [Kistimonas sp.]